MFEYQPLVPMFELMRELFDILNRRRRRRGSIDFDLPEAEVILSEIGEIEAIVASERNIAHRIIEEFMLLANETVAAHLEGQAVPALHRVHEAPDAKKVEEFEAFITTLGYSLAARGRALTPKHFQKLIDRMRGTPEERPIAALMLRTMQKARYDAASLGHFGLAVGALHALHVTDSPVSRSRRASHAPRVASGADRQTRGGRSSRRSCPKQRGTRRTWSGGPTKPSANCCSGRRFASWPTRLATSTAATSPASRRSGCSWSWSSTTSRGSSTCRAWRTTTTGSSSRSTCSAGNTRRRSYRLGDRVDVQVVRVDMERRQVDLGLVEILEHVRRDERGTRQVRSRVKPKKRAPTAAAARQARAPRQKSRRRR